MSSKSNCVVAHGINGVYGLYVRVMPVVPSKHAVQKQSGLYDMDRPNGK
jgi:hypothetical protein